METREINTIGSVQAEVAVAAAVAVAVAAAMAAAVEVISELLLAISELLLAPKRSSELSAKTDSSHFLSIARTYYRSAARPLISDLEFVTF